MHVHVLTRDLFAIAKFLFTARHVCIARTLPWRDVFLSAKDAAIVPKRLYISSKFFHHPVALPF